MNQEILNARKEQYREWHKETPNLYDTLDSFRRIILTEDLYNSTTMTINEDGESYTDGKRIVISMADCFLREIYGTDFWQMIEETLVMHESQHVLSSLIKESEEEAKSFAKWFYKNYKFNKSIGEQIAFQILNILEDGRIENIIANNYPGYANRFLFKNGEYRVINQIREKAKDKKTEFEHFFSELLCYAKCGAHAIGINLYHGEDMEQQFLMIQNDIDRAVAANSCMDMLRYADRILKTMAPYIAKLLEEDSNLANFLQSLPPVKFSGNHSGQEIDFNTNATPGQGILRLVTRIVPNEDKDTSGHLVESTDEETQNGKCSENPSDSDDEQDNSVGQNSDSPQKRDGADQNSDNSQNPDNEDLCESAGGDSDQAEQKAQDENLDLVDGNKDGNGDSSCEKDKRDDSIDASSDNRNSSKLNSQKNKTNKTDLTQKRMGNKEMKAGTDLSGDFSNIEMLQQRGYTEDELREGMDLMRKEREQEQKARKLPPKVVASSVSPRTVTKLRSIYQKEYNETIVPCGRKMLPQDLEKKGAKLENELLAILKIKYRDRFNTRKGLINANSLWKVPCQEDNLFCRRNKRNKPSVAIYLLIDNSGSMSCDSKSLAARYASAIIERAFGKFAACKIVLFASASRIEHWIVKEFDQIGKYNCSYNSLDTISATGGNRDGSSIRIAYSELQKRPEKKKFLIVLSDGCPSDYESNIAGIQDVREAVAEARSAGMEVISIPFGSAEFIRETEADFVEMYRYNIISALVDDIPDVLSKLFKDLLS